MFAHPLSNKQVMEELDKKIYGHTRAKKILINAINRSRIRWHQEFNLGMTEDLIENKNVLLIGGSGTGKTFLVQCLKEVCDFPLLSYDATQLVPSGSGDTLKVSKIIKDVQTSCSDWAKVSEGRYTPAQIMRQQVIFIDEVDKLGWVVDSTGNWNKDVQANLLKLITGQLELQGVTFIFAGAFNSINREATQENQLGFVCQRESLKSIDYDEEIIKAGMLPELVGRLGAVVHLDILKRDQYCKILDEYVLPKVRRDLSALGLYEFSLTEYEKDIIIDKAFKGDQGVRMLHKEVQKMMEDLEFNFEDDILDTLYLDFDKDLE